MESPSIGLVAWGLKLGYQVFFAHPTDLNQQELEPALEDIRGIVHFSKPDLKFFSIGFTSRYKVFTVFQSIMDWRGRDGAYFAFSLFLHHKDAVPVGILKLLNDLSDSYKDKYVDQLSFQIRREPENTALFIEKLSEVTSVKPDEPAHGAFFGASGKYAWYAYDNEGDLAYFFEDPYRNEFQSFKTIYFISRTDSSNQSIRMTQQAVLIENLPLESPKYGININVMDAETNSPLSNTVIMVSINGQPFGPLSNDIRVKKSAKIEYYAEVPGYKNIEKQAIAVANAHLQGTIIKLPDLRLKPERYHLVIKILDENDKPLQHAKVTIKSREDSGITDHSGIFKSQKSYLINASLDIIAEANNYDSESKRLVIQPNNPEFEIKLKQKLLAQPLGKPPKTGTGGAPPNNGPTNQEKKTFVWWRDKILVSIIVVVFIALLSIIIKLFFFDDPPIPPGGPAPNAKPDTTNVSNDSISLVKLRKRLTDDSLLLTHPVGDLKDTLTDLKSDYDTKNGILKYTEQFSAYNDIFINNKNMIETLIAQLDKPVKPISAQPETSPQQHISINIDNFKKNLNTPQFLEKNWAYYNGLEQAIKNISATNPEREKLLEKVKIRRRIVVLKEDYRELITDAGNTKILNKYKDALRRPNLNSTELEGYLREELKKYIDDDGLSAEQQEILRKWIQNN